MRLSVEIMLRGNNHVFTETLVHPTEPAAWTDDDVAVILKGMLRAMARAQGPEAGDPADVTLRGMNWIVASPSGPGGGGSGWRQVLAASPLGASSSAVARVTSTSPRVAPAWRSMSGIRAEACTDRLGSQLPV